jgi:hypothetical protein
MLDAHSQVWGMGEDSVFNGNLAKFRDGLVPLFTDATGTIEKAQEYIEGYAEMITERMHQLASDSLADSNPEQVDRITRICDKMLFNYRYSGATGFSTSLHLFCIATFLVSDPEFSDFLLSSLSFFGCPRY